MKEIRACLWLERKLIIQNWLSSISFGLSESLDGSPEWTVSSGNTPKHIDPLEAESWSPSHSLTLHLQESSLVIWEYWASHHKSDAMLKETRHTKHVSLIHIWLILFLSVDFNKETFLAWHDLKEMKHQAPETFCQIRQQVSISSIYIRIQLLPNVCN